MEALTKGERLAHYEILEPLGEGGMGCVYKAIDSRLNRTVAIKIAKAAFSDRFQREAQAIAQVEHPHICVLYDVGPNYLVMEYLDGAPLGRKLPLKKALAFGADIADALHAAHEHGIVHRDLKPSNIMVTAQGVKLVDFGLAKVRESRASVDDTVTNSITTEGTVLGTSHYMSPEQLEGNPVDPRTDIFALGCVLYEMVTGQKAFDGKNTSSVAAAILAKEPSAIRMHQPFTPPALERVIERCLAKDPDERWHCARDIAIQLRSIGTEATVPAVQRRWLSWVAFAAVSLTLIAALGLWSMKRAASGNAAALQATIPAPVGTELTSFGSAISPDGKLIVVTAETEGKVRTLWLRSTDARTSRELPGTEDASFPFWSFDSKSIGYFAEGYLKRLDLDTGESHRLSRASNGRGGTWAPDGTILFSGQLSAALLRIPAEGGTATWATQLSKERGETRHNVPQFLPDGKHFLVFVRTADPAKTGTYVGELGSSRLQPVDGLMGVLFQSILLEGPDRSTHLLYVRDNSAFVQGFDTRALKLTGRPRLLPLRTARSSVMPGFLNITASRTGLLLEGGIQREQSQLIWRDRAGTALSVVGEGYEYITPALSRDGKRIAVSRADASGSYNVWVGETGQTALAPLTFHAGLTFYPMWSVDGASLYYSSDVHGAPNVYVKDASGSTPARRLMPGDTNQYAYDLSDDGKYLIYSEVPPASSFDLHILAFDAGAKSTYLATPASELHGQFSPGVPAKYIAYTSDESGAAQVYVRRFATGPAPEEKWQVSTDGGLCPRWRRDGKELFYITRDGRMMAVDVKMTDASISFGQPRMLFGGTSRVPASVIGRFTYSVTADGQRFLALGSTSPQRMSAVELIVNWQGLLRN
jgi:eukaryotic-like serine/threonine-protein kinase